MACHYQALDCGLGEPIKGSFNDEGSVRWPLSINPCPCWAFCALPMLNPPARPGRQAAWEALQALKPYKMTPNIPHLLRIGDCERLALGRVAILLHKRRNGIDRLPGRLGPLRVRDVWCVVI